MHRSLIAISVLGIVFLASARASAAPIPGTDSPVEGLAEGLAWSFSVAEESANLDPQGLRRDVWRFRSVEPYSETHGERLYLRFSLGTYRFEAEQGAIEQFDAWSRQGKADAGLTYAWVRVFRRGEFLYRLDIPCTFSKPNVEIVATNLAKSIFADAHESHKAMYCVCGGSCVDGEYSLQTGFQ